MCRLSGCLSPQAGHKRGGGGMGRWGSAASAAGQGHQFGSEQERGASTAVCGVRCTVHGVGCRVYGVRCTVCAPVGRKRLVRGARVLGAGARQEGVVELARELGFGQVGHCTAHASVVGTAQAWGQSRRGLAWHGTAWYPLAPTLTHCRPLGPTRASEWQGSLTARCVARCQPLHQRVDADLDQRGRPTLLARRHSCQTQI